MRQPSNLFVKVYASTWIPMRWYTVGPFHVEDTCAASLVWKLLLAIHPAEGPRKDAIILTHFFAVGFFKELQIFLNL